MFFRAGRLHHIEAFDHRQPHQVTDALEPDGPIDQRTYINNFIFSVDRDSLRKRLELHLVMH